MKTSARQLTMEWWVAVGRQQQLTEFFPVFVNHFFRKTTCCRCFAQTAVLRPHQLAAPSRSPNTAFAVTSSASASWTAVLNISNRPSWCWWIISWRACLSPVTISIRPLAQQGAVSEKKLKSEADSVGAPTEQTEKLISAGTNTALLRPVQRARRDDSRTSLLPTSSPEDGGCDAAGT